MAIPARSYYSLHKRLTPLIRLYRRYKPMPQSPTPASPDQGARLTLVPTEALTKMYVKILQRLTVANPTLGNYVEFGVYNGTSLTCMFRALSAFSRTGIRLIGFDSFEGLPPEAVNEDRGVWKAGQFSCPLSVTMRNLEEAGVPPEQVHLVSGWFKTTLKQSESHRTVGQVSVVLIDSDTYSSAASALEFVAGHLTEYSAILFDDWKLNDLDIHGLGEFRAFQEFLDRHPEFEATIGRGYNRKSKVAFVKRIRSRGELTQ